jgi:TolA-binding protein
MTKLMAILLLMVLVAMPLTAQEEQIIPDEQVLWETVGASYAAEEYPTAIQQLQLYLGPYNNSDRAAKAQFMLGESYFNSGDYELALEQFNIVGDRNGKTSYLEASVLQRSGECYYNLGYYDRAMEQFTKLLKKHRNSFLVGEALYSIGQTGMVTGDWQSLEKTYRRLLEERPGYYDLNDVKLALGLFEYQAGNYEDAIVWFKDVPTDFGLYFQGRCQEESGQYILAIQKYRQALRRYPDSPLTDVIAFNIAEAFYNSDQNKVAEKSYRKFLNNNSSSRFVADAHYKLACISYRNKNWEECVRRVDETKSHNPYEQLLVESCYLAGLAWMEHGSNSHASFEFTEVVRRAPGSDMASSALHKIIYSLADEQNWSQTILTADEFLVQYSGDELEARVQILKGFSHFKLEEYELAVRSFQNVMDRFANSEVGEKALFLATSTYYHLGQYDRIITNFNFVANRLLPTPSDWRAKTYYHLAEAYYNQGLFREASGMYRLVLTGYPRSDMAAASLQGLVASRSQLGEYQLALDEQEEFLIQMTNADSETGSNSLALGSLYFNRHEYEEALQQFTKFIEANPDDSQTSSAILNLADCYYRLQYYEEAVNSWKKITIEYPNSAQVEESMYRTADTQFGLGQFADAALTYSKLHKAYPEGVHSLEALFGVANSYYNSKQDDLAINAFNEFIDTYPEDLRVEDAELGIQSSYYRSGRDMEEYLATRPDSPMAADHYWTKGQNAFADNNYEAAAVAFERVTLDYADSENGPGALFYLAESYYRMDKNQQALSGYRNFTITHPEHELAGLSMFREGTALYRLGEFEEAAVTYEILPDIKPDSEYASLALFNASLSYQEVEEWPAAVGALQRLKTDYPDSDRAKGIWYQIAGLYQDELGDFAVAIDAWGKSLDEGSSTVEEVAYRQGECYEKLNDIEQAIASYDRSGSGSDTTSSFRIASLARLGELSEEKGDWTTAVHAWNRIVETNGKPEWTDMAQARIQEIQSSTGN